MKPSPMILLARSVSAEHWEAIEFPRVNGGMASVAFVEAMDSTSSSDHTEDEEEGGDRRAISIVYLCAWRAGTAFTR